MNLDKNQLEYLNNLLLEQQNLYASTQETEYYDFVTGVRNEIKKSLELDGEQFDYIQFVASRINAQQEYAEAGGTVGPKDEMSDKTRYAKVIEFMGHMIEEIIEARVLVPRRSWKTSEQSYTDSPDLFKAFVAEMYDILLFHAATLAYAGVNPQYFAKIIREKDTYNAQRTDHNKNVPAALRELHGDCQSSTLKSICEHPDEELTGHSLEEVITPTDSLDSALL